MTNARPRRSRSELDKLVDLIRLEVVGLQDVWDKSGASQAKTPEYESYLITLSALNHVQSRLAPGRYWTLLNEGLAPVGTEQCLRDSAGICGNHAQAMVDVMRRLGCQARLVDFYFIGALGVATGHSAVEVAWSGRWHLVDVTNGVVFRRPRAAGPDLLSVAQLLETPNPRRLAVLNGAKPDFQMTQEFIGDPLDYLSSDPDVVLNGEGTVRVRPFRDGDRLRFPLDNLPNYVGSVPASDGTYGSLRLRLLVDEPVNGLDLLVGGMGCYEGNLCIRSDQGEWNALITPANSMVELPARADGHFELSIQAAAETACYVIFESVSTRLVRTSAASPPPPRRSGHTGRQSPRGTRAVRLTPRT